MSSFKKTPKQKEAIDIISKHIETLLEGGTRSGKTFIEIYVMFARAIKYAGTDHLSVRAVFNDAKKALWYKTIPDVHRMCFPTLQINYNKTDFFIEFPNGSRYWIGGLDNRERLEKVLGNEYATIHENEISQISYTGHSLLKTRLNPPKGVKPLMLLDQNPSHKRHWGYKIFHQGINPVDDTPIADMSRYGLLKMNPADNLENISETYMDTLLTLSEQERKRFIDGEYTDIVGAIYNRFNDSMVITSAKPCDYYVVGVDLITYAAVLVGFLSNDVIVVDELGGKDLTAAELNRLIVAEWGKYRYRAYIDWNLSETGTREFDNSSLAIKGAGSVEAGINQIKQLMESGHFWIHEKCIRTRTEIEGYRRDDNGKIVKESDHFCVTGETIVNTTKGNYKIKDLLGKEGHLYCYNELNKKKAIGKYKNVMLTKQKAKIIKVELEDGRVIRCTKDHPILTNVGWIRAVDLKTNNEVIDINVVY